LAPVQEGGWAGRACRTLVSAYSRPRYLI